MSAWGLGQTWAVGEVAGHVLVGYSAFSMN